MFPNETEEQFYLRVDDVRSKTRVSGCCYAFMPDYPDSDICPECGEHCEAIDEEV